MGTAGNSLIKGSRRRGRAERRKRRIRRSSTGGI
jgi:hypothetical protein